MKLTERLWLAVLFVAVIVALYFAFIYAPTEEVMGVVQRIFYFHVASAWAALLSFLFVFIGGAMYLWTKKVSYDHFAHAAVELGVFFSTIVLVTGPIWAKPVWNVWWTWDPRLTSTFVLWLIYIAYLLLRSSLRDHPSIRAYASVYGIIGFVDVPIVWMSIRWWRTIHPLLITSKQIRMESSMWLSVLVCFAAIMILYSVLLGIRMRQEALSEQLDAIHEKLSE